LSCSDGIAHFVNNDLHRQLPLLPGPTVSTCLSMTPVERNLAIMRSHCHGSSVPNFETPMYPEKVATTPTAICRVITVASSRHPVTFLERQEQD
jgi:hypothetical protein